MSKHRKTLRQKQLADLREEKHSHTQNTLGLPTQETTQPITNTPSFTFKASSQTPATTTYSLKHDLQKTIFLSSAIIAFQLLLFFLLHNHTLVLPLVSLRY